MIRRCRVKLGATTGVRLGAMIVVLWAAVTVAEDRFRGDYRPMSAPPAGALERNDPDITEFTGQPVQDGYVFVEGMYLPPPYVVRWREDHVWINDTRITSELTTLPSDDGGRRERRRHSDLGRANPARRLERLMHGLAPVIVAFDDQPLARIDWPMPGYLLLKVLVTQGGRTEAISALYERLPPDIDRGLWTRWLTEFKPTPEFLRRAVPVVSEYDSVGAANRAAAAGRARLNRFSYPLSVAGMLVCVLAIGHLLSNRPAGADSPADMEVSRATTGVVMRSLGLVVALSVLDLVWTILAFQADAIRELNPLGSRLIETPSALVAFKLAVTGLAVGLLYALRRHRPAQLASWWACLILTLLAVRWLTLNSLFA